MKNNCILIKKFRSFPDKVIYRGTLKGAKKRIKPSQKDRFEIRFIKDKEGEQ